MADWKTHAKFDGPIVMIGFGSIGTGTLPLILRHVDFDKADMVIVDPSDAHRHIAEENDVLCFVEVRSGQIASSRVAAA